MKSKILEKFIVGICVIVLSFSIVACDSGKDDTSSETNESSQESIQEENKLITTWLWLGEEEMDAFIQDNPGYEINYETKAAGVWDDKSAEIPRLAAAIASGTGPDLFESWNGVEAYYSDLFAPIQPYMDADPTMGTEDFDPSTFVMATFNNQIYFMPIDYQGNLFAWSKDLFEKAGLDTETPPKTWDEYLEFARKATIKRPSGAISSIGAEQLNFSPDVWFTVATGMAYTDSTGLKFNWNHPTFVELFEYQRSIAETYGGNEMLGSTQFGFLFFQNVAMTSYLPGGVLRTIAEFWDTEIGISRMPVKEEGATYHSPYSAGRVYAIPKNAKNPEGAWKLINYLSTEGFMKSEKSNYETNPSQYSPGYAFHTATRERLYEFMEPLLTEELLARILLRDSLMLEANAPLVLSPVHDTIMTYFYEQRELMINFEITPQDFATRLQDYSESAIQEFIERKESEGWTFDDEIGGIPPGE